MSAILITGGCGFIGSHLVRALAESESDATIVVFDKLTYAAIPENLGALLDDPRVRLVRGDVADRAAVTSTVASEDFRWVIHAAAESHVDRSIAGAEDFVRTNVLGTQTLLEAVTDAWRPASDRAARRFLHVSTDEVFGSLGPTGAFDESSPLAPRSPYAASKAAADHLVTAASVTHGLPTLITRSTNNYGARQVPEKVIPVAVAAARGGEAMPLYGDGSQVRDWIAVEDHCSALLTVLRQGVPGESYGIGARTERSNRDLFERIADRLDARLDPLAGGASRRSLITSVADRPGHDARYAIDPTKIESLGWKPAIDFESGLDATIDWYLANDEWVATMRARLAGESPR